MKHILHSMKWSEFGKLTDVIFEGGSFLGTPSNANRNSSQISRRLLWQI